MTSPPSSPQRPASPPRERERLSDIEVTGYIAQRLREIQAEEGRSPAGPSATGSTVVGVAVAALFAAHDAGELG